MKTTEKVIVKEDNSGNILVYLYDKYTEYATVYEDLNKDCLNLLKDFFSGKSYCSEYEGNIIAEVEDFNNYLENFDRGGGRTLLKAHIKDYEWKFDINSRFFEIIYLK